jgi:hypothetical protein
MNYYKKKMFKEYDVECLFVNQLVVCIEVQDDLIVHFVHVNIELNQLVFPEHFLYNFHH